MNEEFWLLETDDDWNASAMLSAGGPDMFVTAFIHQSPLATSVMETASTADENEDSLADIGLPAPCSEDSSFEYEDLTQLDWVKNSFVLLYSIIIASSLVGNFMVIWTIVRNKHMRTVTNYYILNLAVADFVVAGAVMPLKLLEYTAPCRWNVLAHPLLCPLLYYILPVFVFTSVLTLAAISIERYYAIVHPLNAIVIHSKRRTRKVILATWILPILLAAPFLYCKSYTFTIRSHLGLVSRQICNDRFDELDLLLTGSHGHFRRGFFLFLFLVVYLLPLIVIGGTCIRIAIALNRPIGRQTPPTYHSALVVCRQREENKRKVARMIMLVAMVFLICWTPFYSISLISQLQQSSFLQKSQFLFTMLAAHWTGFLNSCLNPFIYSAMSNKFRRNFKQMLLRCVCCCSHLKQSRKRRRHHFECQILDKSCRFIAYEDICAVVGGRECAELKIFPDTTGLS